MVENREEYVLQWDAHAQYITERFSGLFARQALVDVTLICDEQKLRVHKLVLASCSLYFEEMLQQDLGQEPIIFLDLNFEILKAMVEFMYCGETTISQHSLPSLLEAAENFKVKELAFMVEKTIRPRNEAAETQKSDLEFSNNEQNFTEKEEDEDDCSDDAEMRQLSTEDTEITETENTSEDPTLYEDLNSKNDASPNSFPEIHASVTQDDNSTNNFKDFTQHNYYNGFQDSLERVTPTLEGKNEDDESLENHAEEQNDADYDLVTMSYKEYCDILTNTCTNDHVLQSCEESCFPSEWEDFVDSKVGQCLRVYTHKKRMETSKTQIACMDNFLPGPSSTTRIDLSDESLGEERPITLQSSLDTDSLENILSLDSEDGNETGIPNRQKNHLLNKKSNKNSNNCDNGENNVPSPKLDKSKRIYTKHKSLARSPQSLRRSMRLNFSNGFGVVKQNLDENSNSRRKYSKDIEREMPDFNSLNSKKSKKRQHVKCKRRYHKLSKVGDPNPQNSKKKSVIVTTSIDRALWGDMADVLEYEEDDDSHEFCKEKPRIPFAVGLLPLRAALERMQEMPEHQPRKTRSSVAPTKNQSSCLKRKYNDILRSMELPMTDANKKHRGEGEKELVEGTLREDNVNL